MELFHTSASVSKKTAHLRESGKTIGFVPTMGALHEGHLSLVRISRQQNDYTITSIFVNPNQFNNRKDLERYPRMPDFDKEVLAGTGCDFLFMPDEKQVYPEPDTRVFDFGGLDKMMEGTHRPGHFNGVAQVVTRLFDIVQPNKAYFGLKDFQQLAIIKKVTADLRYPVDIVGCPIIRECDGLAMSSRNMLLSAVERKQALMLSKMLFMAKEMKTGHQPAEVKQFVIQMLSTSPGIKLEYFEIIDGTNLLPVHSWEKGKSIIGCLAAGIGNIRLIDNINFSS
jgi:pantoate--beta-alanine ligase